MIQSPTEIKEILIQGRHGQHQSVYKALSPQPSANRVDNIKDLINAIAVHASSQQEANKITRAITDEFTFYPEGTPLSTDEYKEIIRYCGERAKQMTPDVHLALGTFPVLWPDGGVHNCGLYIQSPLKEGDEAKTHHFSKEKSSNSDLTYPVSAETGSTTYPLSSDKNCLKEQLPQTVLANTNVLIDDINQYQSALKIETSYGSSLIVSLGICLDHYRGIEREQVHGLIEQLHQHQETVPVHCSHVVISSGQEQHPMHTLSTISHSDPSSAYRKGLYPSRSGHERHEIISSFSGILSTEAYAAKFVGTLHSDLFQHALANKTPIKIESELNTLDDTGNTLLHRVFLEVDFDRELIAKRLYAMVLNGGDPLIKNRDNKSVLELANSIERFKTGKDNSKSH